MKTFIKTIIRKKIRQLEKKDIITAIASLPGELRFGLIDIGSAGAIQSKWEYLKQHIEYIGFEPDIRSFDELLREDKAFYKYKILNTALWSEKCSKRINLCRKALLSSIYKPNLQLLQNYRNSARFGVVDKKLIKVDCLDNVLKGVDFRQDYIKLDIQGAELDVLRGSTETLKKAFFLEVEVEFREIYTNQPLFGDVCKFLESENFIFTNFLSTNEYYRENDNDGGDLMFADALFIKDPAKINFNEDLNIESMNAYLFLLLLTKRFDVLKNIELRYKGHQIICKYDRFFKDVNKVKYKEKKFINRILRVF